MPAGTKQIRTNIVELLERDLLGPADGETEELEEPLTPASRYLLGKLAPLGTEPDPHEDDELESVENTHEEEEEEEPERGVPYHRTKPPSSIGLSFLVRKGVRTIKARARWGKYECTVKKGKNKKKTWKRRPMEFVTTLDLVASNGKRCELRCNADKDVAVEYIAQRGRDGAWMVSVFLVNRHAPVCDSDEDGHRLREERMLFQPVLEVTGTGRGTRPFVAWSEVHEADDDSERAKNALLFRNCLEFARGHGAAVEWEDVKDDRAGALRTVIMPKTEVPGISYDLPPGIKPELSMKKLAGVKSGAEAWKMLKPLVDGYERWIKKQEKRVPKLRSCHRAAARRNLNTCREACKRIKKGLELIKNDNQVFEAFRFANDAMYKQRTRPAAGKAKSAKTSPEWRPFQVAFILLNIRGIVEPHSDDRSMADLLWFPTGGGKTEAYLGLTAFVFAWRRLRGDVDGMRGDAGTAVIMRYTLRLLTIQQFQRAASLVCACELIRRTDPGKWGEEPFRIGLWIGKRATPNTTKDAEEALKALRKGSQPQSGSPVQLVTCPWCGTPITHNHYIVDERTLVLCPNGRCPFSRAKSPGEGIPVVVVDLEIYRLVPSIIIATVDKFARMPWKGEVSALFGKVNRYCPRHGFLSPADQKCRDSHYAKNGHPKVTVRPSAPLLPPDLIIQDELHLISGPLGTLVGLYETAVDWLCARESDGKEVRPKVIASTATIHRASHQIRNLFCRKLRVFPPPALDAGDSFFSGTVPLNKKPGRMFVGVFAGGAGCSSPKVRARVYAVLLAAAQKEFQKNATAADPYMTLVGYFNSLRELGGTIRLLEDDVKEQLMTLHNTYGWPKRSIYERQELTSRIDSTDIPRILELLQQPFVPKSPKTRPVDVLLATNMISVGIDVDRLGLMVVEGQPKLTSEYIQATSRVGRRHPGLIVTLYKRTRPRDASHYETFGIYHRTLYRYVEPSSVTPFSSRARERGLPGLVVAMCRLAIADLTPNQGALNLQKLNLKGGELDRIVAGIVERVKKLYPHRENLPREVEKEVLKLLKHWQELAKTNHLTGYVAGGPNHSRPLLQPAWEPDCNEKWKVPMSLREVEQEVELYLV